MSTNAHSDIVTFSDQAVTCEHCGTESTADVFWHSLSSAAGFECPDCGRYSEA